ncbi:MAG: zinc-binding dehydrogenase [Proteobacteria bacterium]|nr:zinc-binding dehydrogenase [Pseudomonadota bacterium]
MKAVVIREHGGIQNLLFEDIETPKPGPGEVLVRIRATGVNHFDHDIREGVSGITHKLPHVPGVEGVGEIADVGPDVSDVAVGDRVAINFFQSCGKCRMCLTGMDGICLRGKRIGVTEWGTFAEYTLCEAANVIPLPSSLSFESAAASLICFSTAWHMTVTIGQVSAGMDVLVNAAGSGVGSSAVQVAKLHGANVIASAGSDEKLRLAKDLGADNVINYESQDLAEEAMRLTDGKGPDLVVESVGGDVLLKSIDAVAFNGTVVTCGAHAGEIVKLNVIELFRKHVRFQGSHYASKHEVAHVLRLVAAGKLKPVIHKVAALADIQDMARLTANRSFFGKMVLLP